jgi:hypothetical protein
MKREIRSEKFDWLGAKITLSSAIPRDFFFLFDKINAIEIELDKLHSIETLENCQHILNNMEYAQALANNLKISLKYHPKNLEEYTSYPHGSYLLIQELTKMMDAIHDMGFKAKNIMLQMQNSQPTHPFSLEQIILPVVGDYARLASAELRQALTDANMEQSMIDDILRKNAQILADNLYKAEKDNSVLIKKFQGMSEHYFLALTANERLTAAIEQKGKEKIELCEQVLQQQTQLSQLQAENHHLQDENQQIKSELDSLRLAMLKENNSLKAQLHELTQKVANLEVHCKKDDKQHNTPLLFGSFRKK